MTGGTKEKLGLVEEMLLWSSSCTSCMSYDELAELLHELVDVVAGEKLD